MNETIKVLIGVVVFLILLANLAPVALTPFYNDSIWNTTLYTFLPGWVAPVLGVLAVVALIFLVLKAVD